MKQSPELTEFYRAYNDWLERGAPERQPFTKQSGLCYNIIFMNFSSNVLKELITEFHDQIDNNKYPFNDNHISYYSEVMRMTTHLNPKRIQWVKDHI